MTARPCQAASRVTPCPIAKRAARMVRRALPDRRCRPERGSFRLAPANQPGTRVRVSPFARPLLALAVRLYGLRVRVVRLDAACWGPALIAWIPKRTKGRSCLPRTWTRQELGKRTSMGYPLGPFFGLILFFFHRVPACGCRFFARSLEAVGHAPEKVTTDGHDAYPRAMREILGEGVVHRCSQYLNNRLEQDHRGIKGRYHPTRGFGNFVSAARFCTAHDELRDYFRYRTKMHKVVPLGVQREQYRARSAALRAMLGVA